MRITEGLLTKDKQAIIHWTNSKGADFLQQWAGDALPYPLTIEALNALSHCFRIEKEGSFIGMIQQIKVEENNIHIGRFLINPSLTGKGLGSLIINAIISECLHLNKKIACRLLTVDAYIQALPFYEKMGFKYLTEKDEQEDTRVMFIDLNTMF